MQKHPNLGRGEQVTLVVNLYGGPGTGKSTTAAWLFAQLKLAGLNAELVREVAKEWCWSGRTIHEADQHTILDAQIERERMLYGQVDVIVTDSPLPVNAFYARKYCSEQTARTCEARVRREREYFTQIKHVDYWLVRSKAYDQRGRYQTEEQALEVDREQRPYVEAFLGEPLHVSETAPDPRLVTDVMLHWSGRNR